MSRLDNGTNYCNLYKVVQGRCRRHPSIPPPHTPAPNDCPTWTFARFENKNCISFQEIKEFNIVSWCVLSNVCSFKNSAHPANVWWSISRSFVMLFQCRAHYVWFCEVWKLSRSFVCPLPAPTGSGISSAPGFMEYTNEWLCLGLGLAGGCKAWTNLEECHTNWACTWDLINPCAVNWKLFAFNY